MMQNSLMRIDARGGMVRRILCAALALFLLCTTLPALASAVGSITFKALDDAGNAVPGVDYALFTGNASQVGTAKSSSDGSVTFGGLMQGTYAIFVSDVPADYTVPTGTGAVFTVSATGGITYDREPTEALRLKRVPRGKVYPILDEAGKPVAGAVFNIIESGGSSLIDNFTTTEAGLELDLPKGTYTITNVRCPATHEVSQGSVTLTVSADGTYVTSRSPTDVFVLKLKRQSISFTKLDDVGKPVAGAVFKAVGRNVNTTFTSNASGVVTLSGLVSVGAYVLSEQSAPTGYTLSQANITVTIDAEGKATYSEDPAVAFVNKRAATDVTFTLRDDGGVALTGAKFKLEGNGKSFEADSELSSGRVLFKDVPFGEYTMTQSSPAGGFAAIDSKIVTTVFADGKISFSEDPATAFKGKRTRYSFTFVAKDELGQTMSGATYKLEGGNQKLSEKSDLKGTVTFQDLLPGTYTLSQSGTPAGRTRSTNTVTVTVAKDGKVTFSRPVETTIVATVSKYAVSFEKHDDGGNPVEGAAFRLTGKDSFQLDTKSDRNGKVSFGDLDAGTYTLTEQSAPAGYTRSRASVTITVSDVGNVTYSQEPQVAFVNPRGVHDVRFLTTDEQGKGIGDAEFRLEGGDISRDMPSNRRGNVTFPKLPIGTYHITQTVAPEGYTRSPKEAKVIVDPDGTIRAYAIERIVPNEENKLKSEQVFETMLHTLDGYFVNAAGPMSFGFDALVDMGAGRLQALEGAEFVLANEAAGESFRATSEITGATTFYGVEAGEYLLFQSSAPPPLMPDTRQYRVSVTEKGDIEVRTLGGLPVVDASGTNVGASEPVLVHSGKMPYGEIDRISSLSFVSTRDLFPLVVSVVEQGTGKPVAGLLFYYDRVPDGKGLGLMITDAVGEATSLPLAPGSYYITPDVVPVEYELALDASVQVVVPESGPPQTLQLEVTRLVPEEEIKSEEQGFFGKVRAVLGSMRDNLPGTVAAGASLLLLAGLGTVALKKKKA